MALRVVLMGKGPGRAKEFIEEMKPEYESTYRLSLLRYFVWSHR